MKRVIVLALAVAVLPFATHAAPRRIGHTTEGRRLVATHQGDSSSSKTVLVVGCIHGNECAGKAIVHRLRHMGLPHDLELLTIRDINPDGSRAGTRQNGRGVDLNRNFSYRWRSIGEPWDTYHSGPRPFSEPESMAARDFILEQRPDITIWYHQHMSLVVKMPRHLRVQRRYARLVGLPLTEIDKLPGTATRWQNHRFPNHIAFVVELPGGSLTDEAADRHARAVLAIGRML